MKSPSSCNYFFLSKGSGTFAFADRDSSIYLPDELISRLRPGDGLLTGIWNECIFTGEISSLCVVKEIVFLKSQALVEIAESSINLRPNPAGRRWWRGDYFRFADSVRERYMLDDIFGNHFPNYASISFVKPSEQRHSRPHRYQKRSGYIYVLHSDYGYKIGKTVNLTDRAKLFEVKLPFKFTIKVSGYVDDYSRVEADLHRKYAKKRLGGEWFNLDENDIQDIEEILDVIKGSIDHDYRP